MAKLAELREGVEVSVESGIGHVLRVEEPKGRNARVAIKAEHLDIEVTGWVDTANRDLYERVVKACEGGFRVSYRVVIQRKRTQPKECPLAEIPTTQRVRDLEAIDRVGGTVPAGTPQTAATPGPVAAPAPAPPSGLQEPPSDPTGPVCGLCWRPMTDGSPVRKVSGLLQHVDCPPAPEESTPATPDATPANTEPPAAAPGDASPPPGDDPSPADPHDDTTPAEPSAPPAEPTPDPPRPTFRVMEGRPWEFANSDGTLNLGSYAFQAAEGIVLLAQEQLLERARRAEGQFVAPKVPQIRRLARLLLKAADNAQAALRSDGQVVRMASSHSRARSAVRASLAIYPVPTGATPEELEDWVVELGGHAAHLLQLSVDLIDPGAIS